MILGLLPLCLEQLRSDSATQAVFFPLGCCGIMAYQGHWYEPFGPCITRESFVRITFFHRMSVLLLFVSILTCFNSRKTVKGLLFESMQLYRLYSQPLPKIHLNLSYPLLPFNSGPHSNVMLMLLSRGRRAQGSTSFPWTSITTRATCSGSWRSSCRILRYRAGWRWGRASWVTWNSASFCSQMSFPCFPSACGGSEVSWPPRTDKIPQVQETGRQHSQHG